jgi:hypothetical protein
VLQRIERGLPREEQGRLATAALIDSGRPFDGLFGVSDEIALGALKELASRGYVVPDQIGVVGFDGVRAGAWSTPPLTTVESDFEVAGSLLVDRLLAMIAGEKPATQRVPVRLVVRGSTRPEAGPQQTQTRPGTKKAGEGYLPGLFSKDHHETGQMAGSSSTGELNSCQRPLITPKPTARPRPRTQEKYHIVLSPCLR